MGKNFIEGVVYILLGSGGAAFIWTITRSYLAIRGRVDTKEDKALKWILSDQEDCRRSLARERTWGAYWFRRAGQYEHELASHGIPFPPNGDPPPLLEPAADTPTVPEGG